MNLHQVLDVLARDGFTEVPTEGLRRFAHPDGRGGILTGAGGGRFAAYVTGDPADEPTVWWLHPDPEFVADCPQHGMARCPHARPIYPIDGHGIG